jgi:hypothetical protein
VWNNGYEDWFPQMNLRRVHNAEKEDSDHVFVVGTASGQLTVSEYAKRFGAYSLAHQNWMPRRNRYYLDLQYIGNCWAVPFRALTEPSVLEVLCDWPRGSRGYDLYLQSVFRASGMKMYTNLTASVMHIGKHTKESSKESWGAEPSSYYKEHLADIKNTAVLEGKVLMYGG